MQDLQQKDIDYLKKEFDRLEETVNIGFAKLEGKLEILSSNYMKRDDIEARFTEHQHQIDSRIEGVHKRVYDKVDRGDFNRLEAKVNKHIDGNNIKWGSIAQSIITTILTTAILGALAYAFLNGQ